MSVKFHKDKFIKVKYLLKKAVRACKLELSVFDEIINDKESIYLLISIPVLSAFASGFWSLSGRIFGTGFSLIAWYMRIYIIYLLFKFVGSSVKIDFKSFLRVVCLVSFPGILKFFASGTRFFREVVILCADVWMFVILVLALNYIYKYNSIWKVLVLCLAGFIAQIAIFKLFMAITNTAIII